jgi:TonB family protein
MKGNNLPAPDQEGATVDALGFSVAGDIVELVVLTGDAAFLQTLREAVGGARRIWHVPSADKVGDLILAGEVGILVLDVQALNETATVFVGQIKRQFPDLVVVVAGNRDAETSLAGLISAGTVYRFIHKPLSPGRAKSFADAAVKKYEEQRRRAAAAPPIKSGARSNRGVLIGGTIGALGVIVAATWAIQGNPGKNAPPPHAAELDRPPAAESPPLSAAVSAAGSTATGSTVAGSTAAATGLDEVQERLLAKAQNALLEDHLDEASAAIEAVRKSGVESGRIAFLTAQLAKSRERAKMAQAAVSVDTITAPSQETEEALAMRLLAQVRGAIDGKDFARAASLLETAKGVASAANIDAAQELLKNARRDADVDARSQLLKNAVERLRQDRLTEPAYDSAKYYLLTLRGLDPGNSGLPAAMQDLGSRLAAKARDALKLAQYDAARSWLNEAAAIGYASPESNSLRHDLDAALAEQTFLANVVPAGSLELVKSVQPSYPKKANLSKIQGWVELDFTVAESGAVKDIAVHAASVPGVFDEAAIGALSKWQYKPVLRDARPAPQRARIRIRFALAD